MPFENDIMRIEAEAFRTIFRATIQYFTFCRFNCFMLITEENFKLNRIVYLLILLQLKTTNFIKGIYLHW